MVDLEAAFKFCDFQLNSRQVEYLKTIIFKFSGDLNQIHYIKLKDEFRER